MAAEEKEFITVVVIPPGGDAQTTKIPVESGQGIGTAQIQIAVQHGEACHTTVAGEKKEEEPGAIKKTIVTVGHGAETVGKAAVIKTSHGLSRIKNFFSGIKEGAIAAREEYDCRREIREEEEKIRKEAHEEAERRVKERLAAKGEPKPC